MCPEYCVKDVPGIYQMAGGLGFEHRHSDPESDVLPLDDPPKEHFCFKILFDILFRFRKKDRNYKYRV